jgi:hypothetical protein
VPVKSLKPMGDSLYIPLINPSIVTLNKYQWMIVGMNRLSDDQCQINAYLANINDNGNLEIKNKKTIKCPKYGGWTRQALGICTLDVDVQQLPHTISIADNNQASFGELNPISNCRTMELPFTIDNNNNICCDDTKWQQVPFDVIRHFDNDKNDNPYPGIASYALPILFNNTLISETLVLEESYLIDGNNELYVPKDENGYNEKELKFIMNEYIGYEINHDMVDVGIKRKIKAYITKESFANKQQKTQAMARLGLKVNIEITINHKPFRSKNMLLSGWIENEMDQLYDKELLSSSSLYHSPCNLLYEQMQWAIRDIDRKNNRLRLKFVSQKNTEICTRFVEIKKPTLIDMKCKSFEAKHDPHQYKDLCDRVYHGQFNIFTTSLNNFIGKYKSNFIQYLGIGNKIVTFDLYNKCYDEYTVDDMKYDRFFALCLSRMKKYSNDASENNCIRGILVAVIQEGPYYLHYDKKDSYEPKFRIQRFEIILEPKISKRDFV